jgi:tetratricopeptide (TPR) repeat protein
MKVRCVQFALVSAAWFAASVAISSDVIASPEENVATASKAYKVLTQGDAASAIPLFTQAIDSRELPVDNLANALLNRATAYQMRDYHKLAVEDYSAALNLDAMTPTVRASALYNRGLALQKTGNDVRAIEDYTNALLLNPKFSHAFLARGVLLKKAGQLLFAVSDFERALRHEHPDPARVHFALGETFIKLKRPNDARREFSKTLKLRPDHAKARAHLDKLGTAKLEPTDEADPILTGSITPVSGSTDALKGQLPLAIEPPAELLNANEQTAAATTSAITPATGKKVYVDRLPAAEIADAAEVVPDAVPEVTKPAAVAKVAPVTAKPAKLKMAKVENIEQIGGEDVAADPIQTGTIEPAEVADAKPASSSAAWVVQISSAVSENAAWSTWKKLKAKHKLSEEYQPVVQRADLGAKGVFYRLRLNYEAKDDAQSACKKLSAKRLACFVSKG